MGKGVKHHRFRHTAMAAPFEIIVPQGGDIHYAQQAANAAFAEIDRIEDALSRYREASDISQINGLPPQKWAAMGPHSIACLNAAKDLYGRTDGVFDVTIGPLMACWRNKDGAPRPPSPEALAEARQRVGMNLLEIDEAGCRVRVMKEGIRVDLGGIGKGYAADCAAAILKEWEMESALINAGDSTALALAAPPGEAGWMAGVGGTNKDPEGGGRVALCRQALSGSGIDARGRHIMDPNTGVPVIGRVAAWALCPAATTADALSTAFMVMPITAIKAYCARHPDTSAMVAIEENGQTRRRRFGPWRLVDEDGQGA